MSVTVECRDCDHRMTGSTAAALAPRIQLHRTVSHGGNAPIVNYPTN